MLLYSPVIYIIFLYAPLYSILYSCMLPCLVYSPVLYIIHYTAFCTREYYLFYFILRYSNLPPTLNCTPVCTLYTYSNKTLYLHFLKLLHSYTLYCYYTLAFYTSYGVLLSSLNATYSTVIVVYISTIYTLRINHAVLTLLSLYITLTHLV